MIWCYRSQGFTKKKYNNKHDDILFYVKDKNKYYFNPEDIREELSEKTYKRFKKDIEKYGKMITKKNGKIYYNNPRSLPLDYFKIKALPQKHEERKFGYHPTQKPLDLIKKFILASTKENDIALDCFAGTGTTLLASEQLKRKWIGIEINKDYCEIAKNRIIDYMKNNNQLTLF